VSRSTTPLRRKKRSTNRGVGNPGKVEYKKMNDVSDPNEESGGEGGYGTGSRKTVGGTQVNKEKAASKISQMCYGENQKRLSQKTTKQQEWCMGASNVWGFFGGWFGWVWGSTTVPIQKDGEKVKSQTKKG